MTGQPQTQTPWLTDLPEVRLGLAEGGVLAAVTVCVRLGVGVPVALAVLAGLAAAASPALPRRFSAVVALSAWAFLTGFLVNAGGQLTLHAADLQRMGILVTTALLAGTVPALSRRARAAVAHGPARPVAAPRG